MGSGNIKVLPIRSLMKHDSVIFAAQKHDLGVTNTLVIASTPRNTRPFLSLDVLYFLLILSLGTHGSTPRKVLQGKSLETEITLANPSDTLPGAMLRLPHKRNLRAPISVFYTPATTCFNNSPAPTFSTSVTFG